MTEFHYDSNGLFLGFLAYPYYVDGKKLFRDVINPFFEEHKKRLYDYDTEELCETSRLYKPHAYRMFGTQGLSVLSLIDDYSFCSRHFNKNHIQSLLDDHAKVMNTISVDIREYRFKSIVVTGVHETKDNEQNIINKANNTFLRENNKFPYIGIIRLKIDHRLLLGKGVASIREIKNEIALLFKTADDVLADYIVVDCFDNDEMTVVAFSNSLKFLIQFLGNIRNLKSTDHGALQYYEDGAVCEKHIFSCTYISFGYDIDYDLVNPKNFFLQGINNEKDSVLLNCLMETRPGHRDTFLYHIESKCKFTITEKIASGGSVLKTTIKLGEIHKLEELCYAEETKRDVRKMRVSIQDPIAKNNPDKFDNHAKNNETKDIDKKLIDNIKQKLKAIGCSKIVRDRLLALFEFYDSAKHNLIQTLYFDELSGIGDIFLNIIDDLSNNPDNSVKTIEEALDKEITNMEDACYERIHNRKYAENLLEYSGGIQQHLTAFGYTYNIINTIFTGEINVKGSYTIITGEDRVSSERTHLNLNINHILFPELFVTTAWKEASNKNIKALGIYLYDDILTILKQNRPNNNIVSVLNRSTKNFMDILATWRDFIKGESSTSYIKNIILQDTQMLLKNDETYKCFKSIMNQELLSYFIKDYVVFHFAFQRDFEKMWYYSFKVMLQTTNSYLRLGKLKRVHLIYMLLRLFMIGRRADFVNENDCCARFITEQMYRPFDNITQEYWLECYGKTQTISDKLFELLYDYGFVESSESQITICERNVEYMNQYASHKSESIIDSVLRTQQTIDIKPFVSINKQCVDKRKNIIAKLESLWGNRMLIDNDNEHPTDFIICLLSSFISETYKIDNKGVDTYYPIKSIPRDEDGEIINEWKKETPIFQIISDNMISIPCDTTGGFFLPKFETRERYFALRTVFYRSLWNYRMKTDVLKI